jgi:WD40 repeat protein
MRAGLLSEPAGDENRGTNVPSRGSRGGTHVLFRLSHSPVRAHRGVALATLAAMLVLTGLGPIGSGARAATTGIDVQLPLGHRIGGVITSPTGDPLEGVQVNASNDNVDVSAVTASDGSYVIHAVADGTYKVFADDLNQTYEFRYYGVPDSTAEYSQATDVVVEGATVGGIDIQLGAKSATTGISGTIRNPDGEPVSGVIVDANGDSFGHTTSAADGTYRIPGLSSGEYRLTVEPVVGSDYFTGPYVDGMVGRPETEPTLVTIADGDATGIDIVLTRGRTLSGRVTTTRPATLEVNVGGSSGGTAIPDSAGAFSVHGLVPGTYTASFRDLIPGPEQTETGGFSYGAYGQGGTVVPYDQALSIDLTEADATLQPVTLPRGTDIVGQVTDGKAGLANPYLFVCDAAGIIGCAAATGAADGTFRILHVPSGSFTIFTSVPGRVAGFYQTNGFTIDDFGASPVKVVSGGPDVKGIKIVVPAGGSVAGRITGAGGAPLAGARFGVNSLGIPPNAAYPVSGADGRYLVTGIPTNEYGLFVIAPSGSDYLSGYYLAGAPGNYTRDSSLATTFRVIEDRDRTAPTITFRDPAAGATGVSLDATLSARFSEPVEGVTTSTMQLRDPRGRLIAATVTFTSWARTATLTPNEPLRPGTRYRVTLTSAIKDWSGNKFAGASWSVETAP